MTKINAYNFDSITALAQKHSIDVTRIAPHPFTPRVNQDLTPSGTAPIDFFKSIPKAELHLHRGVMSDVLSTAEIAWPLSQRTDQRLQSKYGSITELTNSYLNTQYGSLNAYLDRYNELASYINKDLDAIRAVVFSGAMRAFENGVRILEIRTSIKTGQFGDSRYRNEMKSVQITPEQEMQAIIDGLLMAEDACGNKIRCFIGIVFRRSAPAEELEPSLDQVLTLSDHFAEKMGYRIINHIDIGGAETELNSEQVIISKAKKFAPVFRKARKHGLFVTAHAGEGQGSGEGSIWQALNSGAQRIGHGTALYRPWPALPKNQRWFDLDSKLQKNASIMALMLGIPFEMCLSSNIACAAEITLGYQKSHKMSEPVPIRGQLTEASQYPAAWMMAIGGMHYTNRSRILPLPSTDGIHTLNTDLSREYALASATFDMGIDVLLGLSRYSIRHAFAPPDVRAWAIQEWRTEAARYLNDPRYSSPDEQAKAALERYCNEARNRLRITPDIIEAILREVHSPHKYLSAQMMQYFREHRKYP